MMDTSTRKIEIEKIRSNNNCIEMTGIPLRYKGETEKVNVYKIPLSYLIYNKYNGRIGTAVQSYEAENSKLNPENEEDKKIIESFLFDSKKDRNKKTMDSLCIEGQSQYGIVTADGTIVDGNRRAMLLNKLFSEKNKLKLHYSVAERFQYFLAIILPEDATEKDMHQLETMYQMGQDDKLEYNAIEKYLKCKRLRDFFDISDIADMMSEDESQIKKWLSILELMEEYLDTYEYSGIYTCLEKTEDQFINLHGYLENYKKGGANVRANWPYKESDISDLKIVCFDYIRARYEGKEFREIAKTGKGMSIFSFEEIWKIFLTRHSTSIPQDEFSVKEWRAKFPNEGTSQLLKNRDLEWTNKSNNLLKGNLKRGVSKVDDERDASAPQDLLERALNALMKVDTSQISFKENPQIKELVTEINGLCWEMKKLLK